VAWIEIHREKLSYPEQQVKLGDGQGNCARVDMRWLIRGKTLVVELDGKIKYTDQDVLFQEKRREDWLRGEGYQVLRFTWADVASGRMVQKLREAKVPERRYFGTRLPSW